MLPFSSSGCREKVTRRKANVLLITVDTLRADRLSCYGYPYIKTPVIDKLAADGVLFEHAMTTVPLTLPSHTSILTGVYPPSHGVRDNARFKLPAKVTTLAEILRGKGYRTGAVVGSYVLDRIFGLDQGFDVYDDSGMTKSGIEKTFFFPERTADRVTDHALYWLGGQEGSRPFFLWVHYYDPHAKYRPPAPFDERYQASPYDGEIAFVDSEMKRLLKGAKKASGGLPLAVVFVSDHGESLGEHGEMTHGFFLYNPTMHVPLIISAPKMLPKGRRISAQVRTVDIAPTILDLVGLGVPRWMEGKSLLSFFGENPPRGDLPAYMETRMPFYQHGWSPLEAISTHGYVYIKSPKPELYDIKKDFGETNNLAEVYPNKARKMDKLLEVMKRKISRKTFQRAAVSRNVSSETHDKLAALGYVAAEPLRETTDESSLENLPNPRDKVEEQSKYMRALFFLADGKPADAVALFKGLLKDNPHSSSLLIMTSRAAYLDNRPEEARKFLLRAISDNPRNSLAITSLARIEFDQGNFNKAKVLYNRALKVTQFDSEIYKQLARIALKEGDKESAVQYLEKALELSPRNMEAIILLDGIFTAEGDVKKVKALFERAIENDPMETALLERTAVLRDNMGDRKGAIELFRKVAMLKPRSAKDIYNLGMALLKGDDGEPFGPASDPRAALKFFRKAIALAPNFKPARERMAQVESWLAKRGETGP